MENTAIGRGAVEMSVVCSDLSLLESINLLLKDNGVISIEDECGVLHYIVDGRRNRSTAAGKVTSLSSARKKETDNDKTYLDLCIKSVLREYGFDPSLIGTELIYRSIYDSFTRGIPLPSTMKLMYYENSSEFGLSYEQSERNVRYAITKSCLKKMRSRAAIRCIQSRIERRMGLRDPLE